MFEIEKLAAQNKAIQLVSSSCNHEMLTPIRCVIEIVSSLRLKLQGTPFEVDLKVVQNTSTLLLNQVKANLDRSLLDQEKLEASPSEQALKGDIVEPVIELFMQQA